MAAEVLTGLTTEWFRSDHIYLSDSYEYNGASVKLRAGVFEKENSQGLELRYRYEANGIQGELNIVSADNADTAGRLFRGLLDSLPSGTDINEVFVFPDKSEKAQGERNNATQPAQEKQKADDIKEGVKGEKREEQKEPQKESEQAVVKETENPGNNERAEYETPDTEPEYTGGTFLEDVEHWIPSLFEDAHKGVANLKNELEDDVTEDNWFGKAVGSSVLDVLDTAMSFTEGIPLGLLDTRRIGEGIAKGTAEGVMEDISRALNVLPQGRILRAVDRAITAVHVVEALNQGDIKTAAMTGGLGAASMAGGKAAAKGIRNRLGAATPPKPKLRGQPKMKGRRAYIDSEMDTTDFLSQIYKKGEWSEQVIFKDGKKVNGRGRNPRDSTVPDSHNAEMKIAVESKRYEYLSEKDFQKFLHQAGGRHNSLPTGTKQWLVVDHRGQIVNPVSKHNWYFKNLGGTSVFEKIFIVTDKGIFEF